MMSSDKPQPTAKKEPWETMAEKAKDAKEFTEQWIGNAPEQLKPGITPEEVEHLELDTLLGQSVTIFGYSLRGGEYGDFAIVLCVPKGSRKVSTFTTGGAVILRKLKVIGDKRGFPVNATVVKPEGKRYYDFAA